MGLIAQIKADIGQITSNSDEFGVPIKFTSPGAVELNIVGLHTRIGIQVDTEGNAVNTPKSHVSFSEKFMTDSGYPVRNSNGEVDLDGHLVEATDSSGQLRTYKVQQSYEDETIGLIVCILSDYE